MPPGVTTTSFFDRRWRHVQVPHSNTPVSLWVSEEDANRLRLASSEVRSYSHVDLLASIFSGSGAVSLSDAFPTITIFNEDENEVVAKFFLCLTPSDTSLPLDDMKAGLLEEPVEVQTPNLDVGIKRKTRWAVRGTFTAVATFQTHPHPQMLDSQATFTKCPLDPPIHRKYARTPCDRCRPCPMIFCLLFAFGNDLCGFKQHCQPVVLFNDYMTLLNHRPPKSGCPLSSKDSLSSNGKGLHLVPVLR